MVIIWCVWVDKIKICFVLIVYFKLGKKICYFLNVDVILYIFFFNMFIFNVDNFLKLYMNIFLINYFVGN